MSWAANSNNLSSAGSYNDIHGLHDMKYRREYNLKNAKARRVRHRLALQQYKTTAKWMMAYKWFGENYPTFVCPIITRIYEQMKLRDVLEGMGT